MTARRRIAALLASTCALALLAGCGKGVDTAKETFSRTTVPASGAPTSADTPVPAGSEDPGHPVDPAFARDKLRLVYPCQLIDTKALMGQYGTPQQPELEDYDKCFFSVNGDESAPRAYITIYEPTFVEDNAPTTQVAGLTTITDNTTSKGTCFVDGLVQRNPDRALTLQVHWDGGDPCDLGKKLLAAAVAKIKDGSAQYQIVAGNLTNLDPCAAVSDSDVAAAIGGTPEIDDDPDLHECEWSTDASAGTLDVHYLIAADPAQDTSESPKPVKINAVSGVSEKDSGGAGCMIAWKHKPVNADNPDLDDTLFEVVEVTLDKAAGGKDDCAAALTVAKKLQPKLPKP